MTKKELIIKAYVQTFDRRMALYHALPDPMTLEDAKEYERKCIEIILSRLQEIDEST